MYFVKPTSFGLISADGAAAWGICRVLSLISHTQNEMFRQSFKFLGFTYFCLYTTRIVVISLTTSVPQMSQHLLRFASWMQCQWSESSWETFVHCYDTHMQSDSSTLSKVALTSTRMTLTY